MMLQNGSVADHEVINYGWPAGALPELEPRVGSHCHAPLELLGIA